MFRTSKGAFVSVAFPRVHITCNIKAGSSVATLCQRNGFSTTVSPHHFFDVVVVEASPAKVKSRGINPYGRSLGNEEADVDALLSDLDRYFKGNVLVDD